jgi:hypothetical protein
MLLMLGTFLSALTFVVLVRSMGYKFSYWDGYHSLNLSQIAAVIPGKVWGFAGLAGLLLAHGINKIDSALIIVTHTLLMISAAGLFGTAALIYTVGWSITILILLPIILLFGGHPWWEKLREHFFPGSSRLPDRSTLIRAFLVGFTSWAVICGAFALLVSYFVPATSSPPILTAGAFAAGYVVGFVSLITPSGLGVREGVIAIILEPSIGSDQALALAMSFRVLHMGVLWLNVILTMLTASRRKN